MGAPLGNKNAEGPHRSKPGDLDHPQTRFTWGWQDAKADKEKGREPLAKHHEDKMYAAGYESGRYGGHSSPAEAFKNRPSAAKKTAARAAVMYHDALEGRKY